MTTRWVKGCANGLCAVVLRDVFATGSRAIKEEVLDGFWPVHDAGVIRGRRTVSWLNYMTGEKNIFFRLHADNKKAVVSIELTHNDAGIQQLYFEQFLQLKKVLESETEENGFGN